MRRPWRLASLTRRGRALAHCTLTLQHGMYLIGTVYNCCTPHASLAQAGGKTTPAVAAGITDHCRSVQELLSYRTAASVGHHPQQRGRPRMRSNALLSSGAGDHG